MQVGPTLLLSCAAAECGLGVVEGLNPSRSSNFVSFYLYQHKIEKDDTKKWRQLALKFIWAAVGEYGGFAKVYSTG